MNAEGDVAARLCLKVRESKCVVGVWGWFALAGEVLGWQDSRRRLELKIL